MWIVLQSLHWDALSHTKEFADKQVYYRQDIKHEFVNPGCYHTDCTHCQKRHVKFKKRSNVIQQPTKYRSFSISAHLRTNTIMGALRTHTRSKTQEREHFMDLCLMSLCLLLEPCMYLTRGLEDHCWADTRLSTTKCPTARMFHHQNMLRAPDKSLYGKSTWRLPGKFNFKRHHTLIVHFCTPHEILH